MAVSEDNAFGVSEEIAERIAGMLMALSDVAEGNFEVKLEVDLPDHDPMGALTVAINQMTQALGEAKTESARSQRELEEKLNLIERQKLAMRELSTPIIEVWEGVLCLPVVGVVDTVRSADMTETLLQAVVNKEAECAIIDITGIDVMDTRTSDHFLRMAKSVRLLGARCVLTGINPLIAQTMVHMGVDLVGVETHRTLRDALKHQVDMVRKRARERTSERASEPDRKAAWDRDNRRPRQGRSLTLQNDL
jgi:rsbT co-antagonist protein RsbR